MPLSKAQKTILKLAVDNNGLFIPGDCQLRGGALNKVITALQNKKLLEAKSEEGYFLSHLGKQTMQTTTDKPKPIEPRKGSKTEKLIKMLQRKNGATNEQIQVALNWQAHSVRGVISGTLKKKMGFVVITEKKPSGSLTYKITG